jgi:hypothetical protein
MIMVMVVNQFLSAVVETWVKTLHIDSWVRLHKEMIEYYVDPLEEDRACNTPISSSKQDWLRITPRSFSS